MTTIVLLCLLFSTVLPQLIDDERGKCGYDAGVSNSTLQILGDHWGYSYDSLLVDLEYWSASPYIRIDSLGASVQNRAIWQLAITADDTITSGKQTIFIHARTHPGEVQAFLVTEQIIAQLISDSDIAQALRSSCIFFILPMYNPDGVELEFPRQNANGVDIESNWDSNPVEPEVAVLRSRFAELMASASPVKVALNMHSAYGMHRYFVYHDAAGTSDYYTQLEQNFINGVRAWYPNGIEPWDYKITWTNGTPAYYPESWWWLNFQENVMALTYEDWNDPLAFNFDSTANAILHGIADYLNIGTAVVDDLPVIPAEFVLQQNYPNPFNPVTTIEFSLPETGNVTLRIFDLNGKQVDQLLERQQLSAGIHRIRFDASELSSGTYLYQLRSGKFTQSKKMILVK